MAFLRLTAVKKIKKFPLRDTASPRAKVLVKLINTFARRNGGATLGGAEKKRSLYFGFDFASDLMNYNVELTGCEAVRLDDFVIGIRLYYVDSKIKMIVERFALGMVKNLNLSDDFAFGEGLNDTFKTNGREENQ